MVLVLDTSLSMYQAGAIGSLKAEASDFVKDLSANGFDVQVIRFASKMNLSASVDAIPDEFTDAADRWTSLSAALNMAFTTSPNAVVVAFSDGADNYSQNHGVSGLDALEGQASAWS